MFLINNLLIIIKHIANQYLPLIKTSSVPSTYMFNNTFSMLEKRKSETRVLTYMHEHYSRLSKFGSNQYIPVSNWSYDMQNTNVDPYPFG